MKAVGGAAAIFMTEVVAAFVFLCRIVIPIINIKREIMIFMFNPFEINFGFEAFDDMRSTYSFDRQYQHRSSEPYITIKVPREDKRSELGRRRIEMLKREAVDVEFVEIKNQ